MDNIAYKHSVTQRDIADAAGVSRSTVTRALRNDTQISVCERERIQKIAEKMGYRPNPMINALMEQVRTGRKGRFQSVIAWVVLGVDETEWVEDELFYGAQARANQLGYGLEAFIPGEQPPRTFLRVLQARGVRGLLFDQPLGPNLLENWNLSAFCSVTVGFRLGNPALHFVMSDWFAAVWSLLNRLWTEGFRRPALALDCLQAGHRQYRIIGGYEAFLAEKIPMQHRIPPWRKGILQLQERDFSEWLTHAHPDALVVQDESFFLNGDFSKPAELPIFAVQSSGSLPGMHLEMKNLGRAAVDFLTSQLIHNQTGIPTIQTGMVIEPDMFGFSDSL